jgi:predicted phosphodiesterase
VRVAALADVHGNALALEAVLADVDRERPDRIAFLGDLTWGSFPQETLDLVRSVQDRAVFVRGNAERDLVAFWDGVERGEEAISERARWMVKRHSREQRDFLAGFVDSLVLDLDGLGPALFCHGSPRSVEELVTEATPDGRMRELLADVEEAVLVTAHTHVRYERRVLGKRTLNPGSVGLPYEGRHGAFWALLGPDVDFRRTEYDVEGAAARMRATGGPRVDEMIELLLRPPSRTEAIEHAERVRFSG